MTKLVWASLPVVAVVGVWGGISQLDTKRELKVVGGKSTVSLFPSVLESNGLTIEMRDTVEGEVGAAEKSVGLAIAKADLRFTLEDGRPSKFDGSGLRLKGGIRLISKTGSVDLKSLEIRPSRSVNDGLQLVAMDGTNSVVAFDLASPQTYFDHKNLALSIGQMDMMLSVPSATRLGKPELAGTLVGTLSIQMDAETMDGGTLPEPAPAPAVLEGPIDVALSNMSSLTALGRTGTYPNGRNGFSMSTTSCNVGTQNIPWFQPMDVRHPVIAMNLYRVKDGKFEQIGWSWLKHGFFATNSPGCGTCNSPGTGTLLGPGCSDTYGTGNNGDRRYLGGRDEVNPFTGVWTCQNSYFSNYQNDCLRRNDGSGLDSVAHRLEVADADLGNAGAQYFYEAYYINQNESTDKYNQIGSRQSSITWTGSTWNITAQDSTHTLGPAINRWGDMRATATPRTEGDVIVAVKVTDLGSGMYGYDYAIYNHDLDRQIREFTVPVPAGSVVQNISFRDIDTNATNQWTGSYVDEQVQWSTGVFGSSTANPLKYSSVFNFRFEANVPPSNGSVKLGMFKTGSGTELSAAVRAPMMLLPMEEVSPANGNLIAGDIQSLAKSDDVKMRLSPTSEGSRSGTGIIGSVTIPTGSFTTLTIGVESRNTVSNGPGGSQATHLWNWTTSAWELIDTRATTFVDSKAIIAINSNIARFINSSDRKVRIRVLHQSNAGITSNRWTMDLDHVGAHAN